MRRATANPLPWVWPPTTSDPSPGLEHLQPLLGAWVLGLLTSSLLLLGELLHHTAMGEVGDRDTVGEVRGGDIEDTKYSHKSSKASTTHQGTKTHKIVSWRIP